MTMHHDPDRLIRAFLYEGEEQLQDRLFDAVRAEIDRKRQRAVIGPWRLPIMNRFVTYGLGTAALVIVGLLLGYQFLGTPGSVGGPGVEPTPTPQASVAEATRTPDATPEPTSERNLTVGQTVFLSLPEYPVAVSVTIPADGWWGEPGGGVIVKDGADPPHGAGVITFVDVGYYVYGDPCQWSTTRPDSPATTVDELVSALAAQASRDASVPVDVTVGGYAGKSITLHVPEDAAFAECDDGTFASWGVPGDDPARYQQGPGQIDKLWILDVDGHVVVIDTAHYAGTPQTVVDELDAIIESATFSQ